MERQNSGKRIDQDGQYEMEERGREIGIERERKRKQKMEIYGER